MEKYCFDIIVIALFLVEGLVLGAFFTVQYFRDEINKRLFRK